MRNASPGRRLGAGHALVAQVDLSHPWATVPAPTGKDTEERVLVPGGYGEDSRERQSLHALGASSPTLGRYQTHAVRWWKWSLGPIVVAELPRVELPDGVHPSR